MRYDSTGLSVVMQAIFEWVALRLAWSPRFHSWVRRSLVIPP
jgi:hypothetical protein